MGALLAVLIGQSFTYNALNRVTGAAMNYCSYHAADNLLQILGPASIQPASPSPLAGTTNVSLALTLTWGTGLYAAFLILFVGTNSKLTAAVWYLRRNDENFNTLVASRAV